MDEKVTICKKILDYKNRKDECMQFLYLQKFKKCCRIIFTNRFGQRPK